MAHHSSSATSSNLSADGLVSAQPLWQRLPLKDIYRLRQVPSSHGYLYVNNTRRHRGHAVKILALCPGHRHRGMGCDVHPSHGRHPVLETLFRSEEEPDSEGSEDQNVQNAVFDKPELFIRQRWLCTGHREVDRTPATSTAPFILEGRVNGGPRKYLVYNLRPLGEAIRIVECERRIPRPVGGSDRSDSSISGLGSRDTAVVRERRVRPIRQLTEDALLVYQAALRQNQENARRQQEAKDRERRQSRHGRSRNHHDVNRHHHNHHDRLLRQGNQSERRGRSGDDGVQHRRPRQGHETSRDDAIRRVHQRPRSRILRPRADRHGYRYYGPDGYENSM